MGQLMLLFGLNGKPKSHPLCPQTPAKSIYHYPYIYYTISMIRPWLLNLSVRFSADSSKIDPTKIKNTHFILFHYIPHTSVSSKFWCDLSKQRNYFKRPYGNTQDKKNATWRWQGAHLGICIGDMHFSKWNLTQIPCWLEEIVLECRLLTI